ALPEGQEGIIAVKALTIDMPLLCSAALLLALIWTAPAHAARLDLVGGVLTYTDTSSSPPVANALEISLASGTYTVVDPAEASIDPTPNAIASRCTPVNATTVTCPASAIASITVLARHGDDRVVLAGVAVPTFVAGGTGNDTLVGGDGDDFFFLNTGDGSDTID